MRVGYTPEQKAKAIAVHDETRSYAKTLRILGRRSRHVLFGWVRSPGPKPKPKRPGKPAKRRGWEPKGLAVKKVVGGWDVKSVAGELGAASHAAVYERMRIRLATGFR